jgi:hypothetical protein
MFRGVMTPDVIKRLATGDRSEKLTGATVVRCLLEPKAGDVLPTKPGDFEGAVSFEAWIQPAETRGRSHLRQAHRRTERRLPDRLLAGPEPAQSSSDLARMTSLPSCTPVSGNTSP